MQTEPNGKLVRLRQTLRALKQSGACEPSFRLTYAVDKTLRNLTADHGNTEAHALEVYDDKRDEILRDHAEEDEEGRTLYQHAQTGAVLAEQDGDFYYAEPHEHDGETHEAGDHWGGQDRAQREAQSLQYKINDQEAMAEEMEELEAQETEVEIHTVTPEDLEKLDVSNVGRRLDLSVLELMED